MANEGCVEIIYNGRGARDIFRKAIWMDIFIKGTQSILLQYYFKKTTQLYLLQLCLKKEHSMNSLAHWFGKILLGHTPVITLAIAV